jgi:hypothetical protein
MRLRMVCTSVTLVLAIAGFLIFSSGRGQDPAASPTAPALSSDQESPKPDFSKLPLLQQQMAISAHRGGDWLRRCNRADGRFQNGYVPDLKVPLDGDHYLRQIGAAYALAKVARFVHDDRLTAIARQSLLTLLLETAPESQVVQVRHTTLPSLVVNRLAAAGLLVLAIHELPAPGDDLLEQAEQLCAFIRTQQGADGSFTLTDGGGEGDPDAINSYPGAALAGLLASQATRPADWKLEVARKALPYYREWWRSHKNMPFVHWQSTAWTQAYLLTKEGAYAEFVNEMNEWLCNLQYVQLDPRHPLWAGGFMDYSDGRPIPVAPHAGSAMYSESLAQACRLARQAGDARQYQRYREALESSLQFLTTLQYTDANTQHFADWYRPTLVGGVHASHQDGVLRLDYTQHAVCALVDYLTYAGTE